MPRQKGKTHDLNFVTQKIDKAIYGLNGDIFTPKLIMEISGVNRCVVNGILFKKTQKGLLQRIRRGCYKKVSDKSLAVHLPSAFVATKVWEVLSSADKPLTNREISEIIEKDTGLNLYFHVGSVIFRWYHGKVLDKINGKRPYEYQIRADYKSKARPVASSRF